MNEPEFHSTSAAPAAAPVIAPQPIRPTIIEKICRLIAAFITHQDFLRCMMLATAILSWAWRVAVLIVATWLVFGPRELTPWLYLAAWGVMKFADPMRPLMGALAREVVK